MAIIASRTPFSGVPFIGKFLKLYSRLNWFSKAKQEKTFNEYQSSLGLSGLAEPSKAAFKQYIDSHPKDHTFFSDIKLDGDKTLSSVLDNRDDATAIRNKLKDALAIEDATKKAAENYARALTNFNKLVSQVGKKYSPDDLTAFTQNMRAEARHAIEAQFNSENQKLNTYLDSDEFKNHINALGVTDAELPALKQHMIDSLKSEQTKALTEFDKEPEALLKNLSQAEEKNKDWLLYLATLEKANKGKLDGKTVYENDGKLMTFENYQRAKVAKAGVITYGLDDKEQPTLAGIEPKDVASFKSLTGREVKYNDKSKTMTIDLPSAIRGNLLNKGYYLDPRQNAKAEFLTIAKGLKAIDKNSKIKMTITGFDTAKDDKGAPIPGKNAMELGRQAYEACIEAGYDPKSIEIEIQGKKYTPEQLFETHPNRLKATEARQGIYNADLSKNKPSEITKEQLDKMKKDVGLAVSNQVAVRGA